jgi:hypothetical protein
MATPAPTASRSMAAMVICGIASQALHRRTPP